MKKNTNIKKNDVKKFIVILFIFSLLIPIITGSGGAVEQSDSELGSSSDSLDVQQDVSSQYQSVSITDYGWIYGTITDAEGNPTDLGSYDPLNDVQFLEERQRLKGICNFDRRRALLIYEGEH